MPSLPTISPLRGLLEVTRLLRAQEDLPELLEAVARTIGESLGFATVVINVYRPEWDDFCVTTVHGAEEARAAMLGRIRAGDDWDQLLHERFLRRGAYFVPRGAVDWEAIGGSYVPPGARGDGPDAWDPEDALFVPLRSQDGRLLGIVSVDEPANGRFPSDERLDVLVALVDHAALAVEAAREGVASERHRRALEVLFAVSSELTAEPDTDEILRLVCDGIREALGFERVCAALVDPETGRLVPEATVGWSLGDPALESVVTLAAVESLLDPRYRREGCYVLPHEVAVTVFGEAAALPDRDGAGPWAWQGHRLVVPLRGRDGVLLGLIWVEGPDDRLLPSADGLQALRIFANTAAAALASGQHLDELRFLADHDPLTRLPNRRAFVDRLDAEVARSARYGRSFGLVLVDLDGFKELNDDHGHVAGDEALQVFASILGHALRRSDGAFRIGGDEFALLLSEASETDTRTVVERAQELLASTDDERLAGVTASFGCASCPTAARDAVALFRLADEALYAAKRSGRGLHFAA